MDRLYTLSINLVVMCKWERVKLNKNEEEIVYEKSNKVTVWRLSL